MNKDEIKNKVSEIVPVVVTFGVVGFAAIVAFNIIKRIKKIEIDLDWDDISEKY